MADKNRRDVLKLLGFVGVTWAATQLLKGTPAAGPTPTANASPTLLDLLPAYFDNTRANIVQRDGQRAMLSSHLYPKATFIRDAFYGPLALDDLSLSLDCYQWFTRTQYPSGQIRTAVPFESVDEPEFPPGDDDSTLLFIIWSAWLRRNRRPIDLGPIERAYAFVRAHIRDEEFITPASAFCYWADTVQFEHPERIAHNQGLYVLALKGLQLLGVGNVSAQQVAAAKDRYVSFYRSDVGALMLGKDSWWADKLDLSALFPEFLLRWLYTEAALPDAAIQDTLDRFLKVAVVNKPDGSLAGLKIICQTDGSFVDRQHFFEPGLNWPGDYHNGGYWPMYTLTALATYYRLTGDQQIRSLIENLIALELATDRRSKEVIILSPGAVGSVNPARSGYTWNALIVPALKWANLT